MCDSQQDPAPISATVSPGRSRAPALRTPAATRCRANCPLSLNGLASSDDGSGCSAKYRSAASLYASVRATTRGFSTARPGGDVKTKRQQGEAEDRLPGRVRRPAQAGESLERRNRAGAQESDHRGGLSSSRPCAPGERRSAAGMRRRSNAAGIAPRAATPIL